VAIAKSEPRWKICIAFGAPLIVAAVVLAGLAWLSAENLSGNVAARQMFHDHAVAIRNLLFRD
jgi:hypothetical protein